MTQQTIVACGDCGKKNRVPATASGTPVCGKCKAHLPWIAEAADDTFDEVVERAQLPVLVDFWAPWCGPCRMVSPALERLAQDYADQIKLVKVNVDGSPQLSGRFDVQGIPTLMVFNGGKVVARQTGAAPEQALRSWLERALSETS